MPSLQITVFTEAKEVAFGEPEQEEVVTISGTSAQSNALTGDGNGRIFRVRLFADTDCYVTWGSDPTALSNGAGGRMLGSENPEYFGIASGSKIAVIERT